VLRASVVSIVLLLAIGQDTALLCRVWCHPDGGARSECQEQGQTSTSPRVMGDDSCGRVAVDAAVLIREDVRRVSDSDAGYAIVVPGCQVPSSPQEARQGSDPGRAAPLESRPFGLALRV